MHGIDDQRAVREAQRDRAAPHPRSPEYGDAVNRYLGAVGYHFQHAPVPPSAATSAGAVPSPGTGRSRVVVGVDDSAASRVAVDHAAVEAQLRGWDLRLVHVQRFGTRGARPTRRTRGADLLTEMVDRVHARAPEVVVNGRLEVGTPGAVLNDQADDDDLLVVGSDHGRAAEWFGSPVSSYVTAHHRGPVMVVRLPDRPDLSEPSDPGAPPPVVVGVDGSPGSDAAAAFGAREARLRGCELVLLYATADAPVSGSDPLHGDVLDPAGAVPIHRRRVAAEPGPALVEASAHACAVVVGNRGRGGLAGLLLGSVSQALIQRAGCPVFVVR